jgi:hypothetical protein
MANHFTRRSINLDEDNFARRKRLAEDMAVSVSAVVRLLIKEAYKKNRMTVNPDQSTNSAA